MMLDAGSNKLWRGWGVDSSLCMPAQWMQGFSGCLTSRTWKIYCFVLPFRYFLNHMPCVVIDYGLLILENNLQLLRLTHCMMQASWSCLCLILRIQNLSMDSFKDRDWRALSCSELHFSSSWDVICDKWKTL